jgi:glucosyl-dolichyl phosphate glucuronosyltransferase
MSTGRRLTVSVLVPTKNRPEELALALRGILEQTALPTQIVIVDQSADDRGQIAVERRMREAARHIPLVYVREPELAGTSAARNRLLELGVADILLFIDDDVELEREFIEELLSAYEGHPEVGGVSGIITNYSVPARAFRCWAWLFVRGPLHDERQPIYWNADRLRHCAPLPVRKFTGAAMSFRAEVARRARFDARLVGALRGEDADFCERLKPVPLVIAPGARFVHRRSSRNRVGEHWLREHAHSAYYLFHRHWRGSTTDRLRFVWLHVGYAVAISLSCLKLWSVHPLREFQAGARRGRRLGA